MVKKIFLVTAATLLLNACSHIVISRSETLASRVSVNVQKMSSFAWGLIPAQKRYLERELCPGSRLEVLESRMTSVDILVTIATAGIYVPQHASVSCAASDPT